MEWMSCFWTFIMVTALVLSEIVPTTSLGYQYTDYRVGPTPHGRHRRHEPDPREDPNSYGLGVAPSSADRDSDYSGTSHSGKPMTQGVPNFLIQFSEGIRAEMSSLRQEMAKISFAEPTGPNDDMMENRGGYTISEGYQFHLHKTPINYDTSLRYQYGHSRSYDNYRSHNYPAYFLSNDNEYNVHQPPRPRYNHPKVIGVIVDNSPHQDESVHYSNHDGSFDHPYYHWHNKENDRFRGAPHDDEHIHLESHGDRLQFSYEHSYSPNTRLNLLDSEHSHSHKNSPGYSNGSGIDEINHSQKAVTTTNYEEPIKQNNSSNTLLTVESEISVSGTKEYTSTMDNEVNLLGSEHTNSSGFSNGSGIDEINHSQKSVTTANYEEPIKQNDSSNALLDTTDEDYSVSVTEEYNSTINYEEGSAQHSGDGLEVPDQVIKEDLRQLSHESEGVVKKNTAMAACEMKPNSNGQPNQQNISGVINISENRGGAGPSVYEISLNGFEQFSYPVKYGLHIHTYRITTDNDCASPGSDYAHGRPVINLGNVQVPAGRSSLNTSFTDDSTSLTDHFNIIGKSIVLRADDYLRKGDNEDSRTSGNPGPRVACCNVVALVDPHFRFNG